MQAQAQNLYNTNIPLIPGRTYNFMDGNIDHTYLFSISDADGLHFDMPDEEDPENLTWDYIINPVNIPNIIFTDINEEDGYTTTEDVDEVQLGGGKLKYRKSKKYKSSKISKKRKTKSKYKKRYKTRKYKKRKSNKRK